MQHQSPTATDVHAPPSVVGPPSALDMLHLIGRHVTELLDEADDLRLPRVRALLALARDEVEREITAARTTPPR